MSSPLENYIHSLSPLPHSGQQKARGTPDHLGHQERQCGAQVGYHMGRGEAVGVGQCSSAPGSSIPIPLMQDWHPRARRQAAGH